ncbi:hypothetical protein [Vitiosangium sp. GDMCC 1.1324]|uniref:hypothetical protein n=1 Tax=Vitiosangium sp. (strain GDMCC 1.1324) TaxID=2138576 RepID=UPI000D3C11AF|nr:hypothetical protein [Vitiosangium sp. GDMCC 1.1324]PTL79975.1 hypothetical protein DAT35_31635 [Vitiosangium sp. GDMCC 1.1324]
MSKNLVLSLCALLVSGCGSEQSSTSSLQTRGAALQQSAATHGYEVELSAGEEVLIEPGAGHQVIGYLDGFYTHFQPGLVRGSVQMDVDAASASGPSDSVDDGQLALQLHDGTNWIDHTVRNVRLTESFYGEVSNTLPVSIPVRFEIRVRRRAHETRRVHVSFARLFGAQCYPDMSQPFACL